ncbi:MAG: hypothetical protein AAFN93_25510 [Bacteroidota bacterium]
MKKILCFVFVTLILVGCDSDDNEGTLSVTTGYTIELLREANIIYQFEGREPKYLGKFRSSRTGIDKYVFEVSTGDDANSLMVVNFYLQDDQNLFDASNDYPLAFIDNITLNEIPRFGPVAELYFENTDGFPNGPGPNSVASSGELKITINAPISEFVIALDGSIDDTTPLDHTLSGSIFFLESPE